MKKNKTFWTSLLLCHFLSLVGHASASECEGGQDVFATVKENSSMGEFIANLTFIGDPSSNQTNLSLTGNDADWFLLEGKTIRLNSSISRPLDKETQGSVLMAFVTCYEDGAIQSEHRITVEILNMNDNKPEFLQNTIQPIEISELTAVNSIAFTVQATDADGDILVYGIDETSPDASYFRVDLPNSGQIILNRSLDYETKTQLQLHLYVVEMNTKELYNTTATLTINVTDGDDQYPQFQPCTLLSFSQSSFICANPVYTVNITEQDEDIGLDFLPGPIQAVDGDKGLRTPLTYTILSGADNGRFVIDSETGEVRLTRRVESRLLTPTLRLRIMAAQKDDPMKYSVATVLVRVLAENRFPPQFSRSAYRGFVSESTSPASLVKTYGNELLILEATDRDFTDGFNPKLQYSLNSNSNHSQLYYITQEGLLIAKANRMHPNHRHSLEVLAIDQESGDVVTAAIEIEVLQKGVPVPQGPLEEGRPHSSGTVGRTGGVVGVCLILLAIGLFVLLYFYKRKRKRRDPANRASVAEGKHPNVVNHNRPQQLAEEVFYHNEAFSGYDDSNSALHGKQGLYTKGQQDSTNKPESKVNHGLPSDDLPSATTTTEDTLLSVKTNGKPVDKPITKSVSFQDFVVVRECDSQVDEDRDRSDSAGLEDINIDLVGLSAITDGDTVDTEDPSAKSDTINAGKDPETEHAILEKLKTEQLGTSDSETDQKALEDIGHNIRNLDLPGPLNVNMVFLQEDKPDSNQTRKNVNEGTSVEEEKSDCTNKVDVSAFSTAELDNIRSNMINPDVSNEKADIADVKNSNSECPLSASGESEVPVGTEEDFFQAGTEEEEGKTGIKIIVTLTDTDEANTDLANEDAGAQDMAERETLKIKDIMLDSPQCHRTKQMEQEKDTKSTSKDLEDAKSGVSNRQYDSEDISTNLDSQDDSNPPATLNPEKNKQAMNHSDLSHLASNHSNTNIQT